MEEYEINPDGDQRPDNFFAFLLKMSNTLQIIDISTCYPEDINMIINQLPVLKSFSFNRFKDDHRLLKLEPNQTITELKIYSITPGTKVVIKSLINLEMLKVSRLENEDLKWIAKNAEKLKTLSFTWWNCVWALLLQDAVEEYYRELKDDDPEANKSIEIKNLYRNFCVQ